MLNMWNNSAKLPRREEGFTQFTWSTLKSGRGWCAMILGENGLEQGPFACAAGCHNGKGVGPCGLSTSRSLVTGVYVGL